MEKVVRDVSRRIELSHPLTTINLGQIVKGNKNADRIVLEILKNEKPAVLDGYTVTGMFINPLGQGVPIQGEIEGNTLTATLSDGCYHIAGLSGGFINVEDASDIITVVQFTAEVLSNGSGAIYDPDKVIGSLDELMEKIAEMEIAVREAIRITQESIESIGTEGNAQVAAIQKAGAEQVAAAKSEGNAQVAAIQQAGAEQVAAAKTEGNAQVAAIQQAGAEQVAAAKTEGNAQVAAIQQAGAEQVAAAKTEGAAQLAAIENKGANTLASIPADYTALSGDVSRLKDTTGGRMLTYTGAVWGNGWIDGNGVFSPDDERFLTDYISIADIEYVNNNSGARAYADYFNLIDGEYVFQVYKTINSGTLYTIDKSYDAVRIVSASTDSAAVAKIDILYRLPITQVHLAPIVLYRGGNVNLDTINKTLTIPNRTTIYYRTQFDNITQFTVQGDTTLDLSGYATKTVLVYLNIMEKQFETTAYNKGYADRIHALVAVVTFVEPLVANISINCPYTINGGKIRETGACRSVYHRGYNATCPENTLPAFIMAAMRGCEWVETDVRYTSDGIPVLMHDATINRTARNADGSELTETVNIADITYAEAATYDYGIYFGAAFAGTKILKFEEFIVYARNLGLKVQIELKGNAVPVSNLPDLVETVKAAGMLNRVEWVCDYGNHLSSIQAQHADADMCWLVNDLTESVCERINSEFKTGKNNVYAGIKLSTLNAETISLAKQKCIKVHAWTVEEASQIIGCDPYVTSFTTDGPNADEVLYDSVAALLPN